MSHILFVFIYVVQIKLFWLVSHNFDTFYHKILGVLKTSWHVVYKLFIGEKRRQRCSKLCQKSCAFCSVDTSSGSSSFTARFYKGSLEVSKARARLDHKIAKLGKAWARNVRNELDFCPKSLNKARARLGAFFRQQSAARTRSFTFSKSSSSLRSGNSQLVPRLAFWRIFDTSFPYGPLIFFCFLAQVSGNWHHF